MPRNNLSRRYNPELVERNDRWDRKFCSLFWSPFEIDTPQFRTEKGRAEELPSSEDEEEPVSGESSSSSTPEKDTEQLSSKLESLNVADTESSELDPMALVSIAISESSSSEVDYHVTGDSHVTEDYHVTGDSHIIDDTHVTGDSGYDSSIPSQLPFPCPECPKRFRLLQYLRAHSIVHTDERPYGCECGQRFRHRNALYNHRKRHGHHDWQATGVACFVCGQQFRSSGFLARHTAAACARFKAANRRKEAEEEIYGV
ncbi:hypothetical protein pipiens_005850 [Culex pipiens pipiens]|uniref:C2H2-type domain-containing protein n=1 Tax=Culex pipiens pipiens TaxID=38569 RepID=A0ABD1DT77_CULPP